MRKNTVKEMLNAGEAAFGTMIFEFFTPGIAQIVKAAGADFILFDMEHSGAGIDVIKAQMAACRGIGLTPMVRVPVLQSHFIARCLDMGAMGIMVPMVETAAQAREIVSATRYPPIGRRGAAFGVAHDDYEGWAPWVMPGGLLAIHDVFPDPADGGRPPYELYLRALAGGAYVEDREPFGSLRVLRRTTGAAGDLVG